MTADHHHDRRTVGRFATPEQAMLAAEMEDALHGGTEPLNFKVPLIHRWRPAPGHIYEIWGPDPWVGDYYGPGDDYPITGEYVSRSECLDVVKAACEADWKRRQ